MRVIGLMSGTSADGIDAALVDLDEVDRRLSWELLEYIEVPFPPQVRQDILDMCEQGQVDTICRMDVALGEWFARAALAVCEHAGVGIEQVDVIGSHGQTIQHLPNPVEVAGQTVRATLQIGNPSVIAERTGVMTVSDFRSRDMAVGGQGAPVVPLVDYLLFRDDAFGRVMLNVGGIANVNVLPAACEIDDVFAFDTGPGNMVIDGVAKEVSKGELDFDRDGVLASNGHVIDGLLDTLLVHPFFALAPPKSTGREDFGSAMVQKILNWGGDAPDLVCTATMWTVECIALALKQFVLPRCEVHEVIASGGGAKNPVLMALLDQALGKIKLKTLDDLGMASEAKEAIAFAILAYQTVTGRAGNVPSVTGASKEVVLGSVTPGRGWRIGVDPTR